MNSLTKTLIKSVLPIVTENLDSLSDFLAENIKNVPVENGDRAVYMLFLNNDKVYVCLTILDGNDIVKEIRETQLVKDFITNLISKV